MRDKEKAIHEAEEFVRRAISHFEDAKVDEKAIKIAAEKVSESLRHSQGKEPVAA